MYLANKYGTNKKTAEERFNSSTSCIKIITSSYYKYVHRY